MAIKKKYQGQALGRGLDALLQTEDIHLDGSSNLGEVSMDSRYAEVGSIKRSQLLGRAFVRIFPFNKFGLLKHQ